MANTTKTVDTLAIFKGIATAHSESLSSLEVIKGHIATLRENGIKFGKSKKTCQYRVQCTDAYTAAFPKTAKKTINNYVTGVVAAVNDNVPFSLSSSKGKGKGKAKGDADKTINPILAKLFSHEDFKATMAEIEDAYNDGQGTMAEIITEILKADGYEIKE